jgi:hypothetical protein
MALSGSDQESRTRRALLAGAFGGVTAVALAAFGRPYQAEAANGDTVKVGQARSGSSLTSITSSASGFKGKSTSSGGSGIIGESTSNSGFGVNGINLATGGTPIGVRGAVNPGNGIGVHGNGPRGVMGETSAPAGVGVVARNNATTGTGSGLRAFASAPGQIAAYVENSATSDNGTGFAIHAMSTTRTAVKVENVSGTSGTGHAIHALSNLSHAVFGENLATAAASPRSSGVFGKGQEFGVEGHGGRIGVFGHIDNESPPIPNSRKSGVRGSAADPNNFGGSFGHSDPEGFGLHAQGGLKFESAAGTTSFTNAQSSKTVTPSVPLGSESIVVATFQSDPGGGVTISRVVVQPLSNNFQIVLSGTPSQNCTVGWIVVN